MVAIIIATGQNAAYHGLDEYLPVPLLPLVDRPFLQHVIESLVRQGVTQFEFVLSHLPEKIEACFGDGARWGCSFRYHLSPSPGEALRVAARIASGANDEVLLASGTRLPAFDLSMLEADSLLFHDGVSTGWARLSSGARGLSAMTAGATDARIPEGGTVYPVALCLSIESGEKFLQAQRDALDGTFEGLMIAGRQADPRVWVGRNVALHPSASIISPVYIGENCRVGKGAQIGPSTVICANCIVDAQSVVVNSMVAPGTYIGEALELDSVLVDRNRLVNCRLGTSVFVSETFLLGNLTGRSRRRTWQRARDRLIALVLLLVLWPLLLSVFIYFRTARRWHLAVRETVAIPAENNPASWKTARVIGFDTGESRIGGAFLSTVLPGLVSVLLGEIFLVGVQPRSRREIESLPADWRSLYLKSKPGLITEVGVMFGPDCTQDEVYTGEAFYSATESGLHDLRLVALWVRGLFVRPAQAGVVALADQLKN